MKKFLLKNSKWIYYILGIVSALIILSSLFFMTQYRFVRISYKVDDVTEERLYESTAQLNGGDQKWMFLFIDELATEQFQEDDFKNTKNLIETNETFKTFLQKDADGNYVMIEEATNENLYEYKISDKYFKQLDEFRDQLDSFNNLILIYGLVSLVCFAGLLILSNHNRKIYYKSNLIGGIVLPLINIIFAVVLIVNALSLVSKISEQNFNALINIVSAMQNPLNAKNVTVAGSDATNFNKISAIIADFNINPTTLIMYMLFAGITIAYNVFLIIYAFVKYNGTARERKAVLDRARLVGEKA
ncbi:MAG: hypothetical protein IJU60_04590 [Acholeplasmatales bacterium]|nr:hypothetical protein [Acholeplasmatales bacterium]